MQHAGSSPNRTEPMPLAVEAEFQQWTTREFLYWYFKHIDLK